ncbi:hypothetical protein ElyMa_006546700 [Elysia marginata]|uniref:Uncharacterized protein n=1 Tax=Elysia marginata TaxID=1093978 RepID=A0AAV4I8C4_9GAST|nr:hypothetical protein ElyMa_006546700 [Elysia marginata]
METVETPKEWPKRNETASVNGSSIASNTFTISSTNGAPSNDTDQKDAHNGTVLKENDIQEHNNNNSNSSSSKNSGVSGESRSQRTITSLKADDQNQPRDVKGIVAAQDPIVSSII